MFNERKMFSDALNGKSKHLVKSLMASSRSEADATRRAGEYDKMFKNYVELKKATKSFSSYADNDLQANQYFNATVTGLAQSFAGFLAIERALDAPEALLYFLDLLGVTSGSKVLPNIGPENIGGFRNRLNATDALVNGTEIYTYSTGKKLIPGSVKLIATVGGNTYTITDDKKTNLLSIGGVLVAGTVDYSTGDVSIEFTTTQSALFNAATDTIAWQVYEDQVATQNVNRFKTEMQHISIKTLPEILVGEADLVSIAAMQKTLGVNPADVVMAKLTELYTKMINGRIVGEIETTYVGSTYDIDLSTANGYTDFRSNIDAFSGGLTDVDQELAVKSVKGVKATAYVVGPDVVKWFRKTKQIGLFTDAPQAYVNDLVGYYDGVPVLEHTDIASDEGYACHKTLDGNLAPVGRGIYLPLTNTPGIGNYNNPTQVATGVFYQEESKGIVPELTQKFRIIL